MMMGVPLVNGTSFSASERDVFAFTFAFEKKAHRTSPHAERTWHHMHPPPFRRNYDGPHRISARWRVWDYSSRAPYFVTICTDGRTPYFGSIANGTMRLTELGARARIGWMSVHDHFPFVIPDAFVVMPDHIHGILWICGNGTDTSPLILGTRHFASQRNEPTWKPNRFGPQSRNLASIIRGYKIGVKSYATKHDIPFAWQSRYHDRVIRDAGEYRRIRTYIERNVERWKQPARGDR